MNPGQQMHLDWHKCLRSGICALLLINVVKAEVSLKKPESVSVNPKVPEKQFTVPAIPEPFPTLPEQVIVANDDPLKAASRLHLAAKEVRLLEVFSLDPVIEDKKPAKGRLHPFHDFTTLGREELKNKDAIQDLLHAVILSIINGPEEAYDCFQPRHGLRIYDKKGFIDVVICYECLQGRIHAGDEIIWFSTNKDAEPMFDSIFAKLGLRKAD
jgi:hypothetical protein